MSNSIKHIHSLNKEQLLKAIEDCVEFNLTDSIPILTELLYHQDLEVIQSSIGALSFLSLQRDTKSNIPIILEKFNHIRNSSNLEVRRCTYMALSSVLVHGTPIPNLLPIFYDGILNSEDPVCLAHILNGTKELLIRENELYKEDNNKEDIKDNNNKEDNNKGKISNKGDIRNKNKDIDKVILLNKVVTVLNNKLLILKDSHTVEEEIFYYSVLNITVLIFVEIGKREGKTGQRVINIMDQWNQEYIPLLIKLKLGLGLFELTRDNRYLNEVFLYIGWELEDIDSHSYHLILATLVMLDELPYLPLSSELISTLFLIKDKLPRLTKPVDIVLNRVMGINFKLEVEDFH